MDSKGVCDKVHEGSGQVEDKCDRNIIERSREKCEQEGSAGGVATSKGSERQRAAKSGAAPWKTTQNWKRGA